ncbi:MAG: putative nucleotidyltransferase with HDIG domain [Bradymonadia bacterium]|jgi:putative nucleotidyltransferase with HDIG domain
MSATTLPKPRTFRDPVHDIIDWKRDPDGALVCGLIDTREMQRLRHVRQLGLASFVFHGAEHSRFSHSIGVAHVARRMCDQLGLVGARRTATIAAALLHDIGHAPFSHVFERVFRFHHEQKSAEIILDPSSDVFAVLTHVDSDLPQSVTELVTGESTHWSRDLVSSQLDADRADYLLRDAKMTGALVGSYDLERILLMLDHDDTGLLVDVGGYEAVEGYLIARYHMYRLVYFHRAARSAETMLERLFHRATSLASQGDAQAMADGAIGELMRGEAVSASAWAKLGEYEAWSHIARWAEHPDPVLSKISSGLLERRLFKCNERRATPEDPEWRTDDLLAERIREELAPGERALFYVDEAADTPYRPYLPSESSRGIRIRDAGSRVFFIEERSSVVQGLAASSYRLRRWFYHPQILPKLQRITGELW